jgi:GH24 family phage-related lysozyme (muramidase)
MPLKDSVKGALLEQIERLEGRVNHFYLDTVGKVTIGIGHQVASEAAAAELPLYIPRMFGWWLRKATAEEKQAEYQFVQLNGPDTLYRYKASYYKQFTRLILLDDDIEKLLLNHINIFYDELCQLYNRKNGFYRDFDEFPDEVQMALFDMIFNLGMTNLRSAWPKFNGAIKIEDWKTAAAESRRSQVSPARNRYVRDLLLMAYQKEAGFEADRSKVS